MLVQLCKYAYNTLVLHTGYSPMHLVVMHVRSSARNQSLHTDY